jgi:hypothetical protein
MNCRRYRQAGKVALIGLALLASTSCSKTVREGASPAYLIIERLQGFRGGETEGDDTLQSDVKTWGGIFEDGGEVQLRLALKDAGTPTSPTIPSTNNYITVDRYRVAYVRADGRNTPGVDVPYAFDGAATGTITTQPRTVGFVLVRAQAKAEAPLAALAGPFFGGASLISTIAEVTFYGRDQVGNAVSVTGKISVNFADWADPEK